MATTTLLIEIVIIGFAFFLSILPLIAILLQIEPRLILVFYKDTPIHIQLAAAYLFGIIWNRVCDQIFQLADIKIIKSKFPSRRDYQQARIKVVMEGATIRDYVSNQRSLIRVVRSSSILLLVYTIVTPIYIYSDKLGIVYSTQSLISIVFSMSLLFFASVYTWFRLEQGYVSALYDAYSISKEDEQENEGSSTVDDNDELATTRINNSKQVHQLRKPNNISKGKRR